MNFSRVWKSATSAGDEISRSIRERQLPPMLAAISSLTRDSMIPGSILLALLRETDQGSSNRSVPPEAALTMALQALSQWMVAVRNNELPAT